MFLKCRMVRSITRTFDIKEIIKNYRCRLYAGYKYIRLKTMKIQNDSKRSEEIHVDRWTSRYHMFSRFPFLYYFR